MSGITCGNCKAKHDTVAQVRACYGQPARIVIDYPISVPVNDAEGLLLIAANESRVAEQATPDSVRYPATAKQVEFIQRLSTERDWTLAGGETSDIIMSILDDRPVSKKEASTTITFLQGCQRTGAPLVPAAKAANTTVTEIGMYCKDGDLFRVYPARSGGHLLCKMLEGSIITGWSFTYVGTPRSAGLNSAHRMSLEDAKAFGAQFGVCCVCAALLTDPTSVAAGIGPICGSRV